MNATLLSPPDAPAAADAPVVAASDSLAPAPAGVSVPHTVPLEEIADYMSHLLKHREIGDYPGAHNGLQMENRTGTVTRIAAAVDSHERVLQRTASTGADLLLVHHGMLWSAGGPCTGAAFRKARTCLDANLAVFSSHLPLDAHDQLGNNALLARAIGLPSPQPFFVEKGTPIGRRAEVDWSLDELLDRLGIALGGEPLIVHASGPGDTLEESIAATRVRRIGIITGGAGNSLREVAAEGIDTFVTGEGRHDSFGTAVELGVTLLYGGHYATETFGVKALAEHVAERFGLPWEFVDVPSGL